MDEKLSLLAELVKFARVDNEVKEEEYMFLVSVGNLLGVDETEVNRLFNTYIAFKPPINENQRILQFYRLVLLMNVDKIITPGELNEIRRAGLRLGLPPEAIEQVLSEMKKHDKGIVSEDVLITIFRKYRN